MAKAKSGGGIKSRNVKQVGLKTSKRNEAIRPGFAGQIGSAIGDHVTDRRSSSGYRGESFGGSAAIPSKLGNDLATNVGAGGPGKGREVHYCGSQSSLPAAKPMAKGRDILREFGPDYKGGGRS